VALRVKHKHYSKYYDYRATSAENGPMINTHDRTHQCAQTKIQQSDQSFSS